MGLCAKSSASCEVSSKWGAKGNLSQRHRAKHASWIHSSAQNKQKQSFSNACNNRDFGAIAKHPRGSLPHTARCAAALHTWHPSCTLAPLAAGPWPPGLQRPHLAVAGWSLKGAVHLYQVQTWPSCLPPLPAYHSQGHHPSQSCICLVQVSCLIGSSDHVGRPHHAGRRAAHCCANPGRTLAVSPCAFAAPARRWPHPWPSDHANVCPAQGSCVRQAVLGAACGRLGHYSNELQS